MKTESVLLDFHYEQHHDFSVGKDVVSQTGWMRGVGMRTPCLLCRTISVYHQLYSTLLTPGLHWGTLYPHLNRDLLGQWEGIIFILVCVYEN
jgi:hypothetical protein